MISLAPSSDVATGDERVILIHGTYAARPDDVGDAWWQVGSDAHEELTRRLPPHVRLEEAGELFHWSGENSERARIKAASDLLARLLALEAAGTPYHLIGHSHGGSVIWHALRLATLQRRDLKLLRSWATVGTPFLHHRTRGVGNLINLLNVVLAIALFDPALKIIGRVFVAVFFPALNRSHAEAALAQPEELSFWRSPVLATIDWLGLNAVPTDEGWRIGSRHIDGGAEACQFLLFTPQGWFVIALLTLVVGVYLHLGLFFLSPVLESLRLRAEKRLERRAYARYRGRWLGLWSPDDEAINALRATIDLSVSFVAPLTRREKVLYSDRLAILSGPYYLIGIPLYNWLVRPILDRWVRQFVVKTLQGNNRPSAEVIEVSPNPILSPEPAPMPSLPMALNSQIVADADSLAGEFGPKLRRLLAEPSIVGSMPAFGLNLSGGELVHTSYFRYAELLDLLAMHVAWSCGSAGWTTLKHLDCDETYDWLRMAKAAVGEELPRRPRVTRRGLVAGADVRFPATAPQLPADPFTPWRRAAA